MTSSATQHTNVVKRQQGRPGGRFRMSLLSGAAVNRVLSVRTRHATAEERKQLALPRGASVLHLERLRLARRDPLIYSLDVLRPGCSPMTCRPPGKSSLFVHLERAGLTPTTSACVFRASHAAVRAESVGPRPGAAVATDGAACTWAPTELPSSAPAITIAATGSRLRFSVARRTEAAGGPRELNPVAHPRQRRGAADAPPENGWRSGSPDADGLIRLARAPGCALGRRIYA